MAATKHVYLPRSFEKQKPCQLWLCSLLVLFCRFPANLSWHRWPLLPGMPGFPSIKEPISHLIRSATLFEKSHPTFRPIMIRRTLGFEDLLPTMAEKLGEDGLMVELCNGFRLLMDPARGLITFDSLKQNAALLGLGGMSNDELRVMLREGDLDGDGGLNEMEFFVLMVRLSPELMEKSWRWIDEAFHQAVSSSSPLF